MTRTRRLFVLYLRPAGGVVPLVALLAASLIGASRTLDRLALVAAASTVLSLGYVALLRAASIHTVVRVMVIADALLLVAVPLTVGRLDQTDIVFLWPIAIAAYFAGPTETVAATVIGVAAALLLPALTSTRGGLVTETLDVVAFGVIGGLLATVGRANEVAQRALARQADIDAAALRISERIRSSLDLEEVLSVTAEELARATDSVRGLVRVSMSEEVANYQWTRPGYAPVSATDLRGARYVVQHGEQSTVVKDSDDPDLPDEVRAYMQEHRVRSFLAVPASWGEEGGTMLGLHGDRPREWRRSRALLERVAPQVRAALVQAHAYRRQQELAEMREALIANVSHELRTPLTSVLGFLRTVQRADLELTERERVELLQIATTEAERLAVLVEDLLSLATSRAWRIEAAPTPVAPVVERAAAALPFGERELRVEVGDAVVLADERRLLQVLTNLLANALRHGRGTVTVRAAQLDDRVEIAVADQGEPIPSHLAEELFAPFARGRLDGSGTGLGLAIARALVEAHGGELRYERAAFRATLPAAATAPTNTSDTSQNASSSQR